MPKSLHKLHKSARQTQINRPTPKPRAPRNPNTGLPTVYPSIGAQIGDGLQKWGTSIFNKIIGNGDYTMSPDMASIQRNDLFANSANQPPSFAGSDHSFLFEHSEYITDIVSSSTIGAFNTQSFTVNPTNSTTFPWLSGLAANFESYEIEGMIFRFESTSGTAVSSTNSQLGSILATYVYDAQDPAFINKQQMLQYDGVCDARSSENILVGVECKRDATALKTLYNGAPPAGADPKFYNHGKLHIASQGMQAASQTIGELWVHYKIRMKVTKEVNNDLESAHVGAVTGIASASMLGDSTRTISGDLTTTVSGNVVTISNAVVGTVYNLDYLLVGSTLSAFSPSVTATSGAITSNLYINKNFNSLVSFTGTTGSYSSTFVPTSSNVVLTLSGTITAVSISGSDLIITPLDINTTFP